MHKSKLAGFIIDCQTSDLEGAARFWSEALGMPLQELPGAEGEKYVRLKDKAGQLHIEVQSVDHASRVHLDIETDNIPAEVERLRALGAEVSQALNPGQQVVKIVNEELVTILGGQTRPLNLAKNPPTVIMLAGLQGSGKTTLAGKLGYWLKEQGHTPMLVAADLQRPNAVTQLEVVGQVLREEREHRTLTLVDRAFVSGREMDGRHQATTSTITRGRHNDEH